MIDITRLTEDIYSKLLETINHEILYKKQKEDVVHELKDFIAVYEQEKNITLDENQREEIHQNLINDLFGFGPLEYLLKDPEISEIMVNHPEQIFVEKKGAISLTSVQFRSKEHIINVARRIATLIHRHIDLANPLLDARLPDGSRVNVVLDPVSLDSPCITIRKFSQELLTMQLLIKRESLTPKMAQFLEICVYCGVNIIVGGGTGAGKTTLLNILSQEIHPDERVITIEDSAELQLKAKNLIRLETRSANAEGKGEIVIYDLIKNCLRMRPDRIIVGEVCGDEVFEMLKTLNTGHDGSMSTVHCNGAHAALLRLENMVATSNPSIPFFIDSVSTRQRH
jgi:pilus assembly protein CpaF